jgi:hypothetical protein
MEPSEGPAGLSARKTAGQRLYRPFPKFITAEIRALFFDLFFARHTLSRSAGGIGAQMQTVGTPEDARLRVSHANSATL